MEKKIYTERRCCDFMTFDAVPRFHQAFEEKKLKLMSFWRGEERSYIYFLRRAFELLD